MSKSVRRWYKELKPSHYVLDIVPDIAAMTFSGTVTIELKKTGRPSQRMTFHQHGLKIVNAAIVKHDRKGDQPLAVIRINNQNSLDEVRLHTKEQIYSGDYTVKLAFSGVITRGMTGVYPCYFNVDGKEHVMLATQLESHHARELFPCVDEPEAKATFDLMLTADKDMTVLANTPIKDQAPPDPTSNLLVTTFETTPKMSTYLLAFVIGELQNKTTRTKRGTETTIWSTIAHPLEALDFALDVARRAIEFFEDYFGVPYPLAKLDHVGLPDFSQGAMENWGLITYREQLLLAYPGESSQSIQEYIATVITHEMAHQWFGDLVTMRWWDEIWLNESFANMMEYQAVDALYPEWHVWNTFISGEGLRSLRRDATPGVQAVHSAVHHPDEINTAFDPAIVYAKGGRLLYMLKTYIGEEAFRFGLSNYFKQHAYGNTVAADLWRALAEASSVDVAAFMTPWLERSGFPVVSVEQHGSDVRIAQTHFLENGGASDGRIWPVPLFANHTNLPARLDKAELHATLANTSPLVINEGSAGHYIVHYVDPEHRAQIVKKVASKEFGIADRLMLLNSASMLAKAGYQSFADVLTLLEAYQYETDEAVWNIMALVVAEARRFIDLDEKLEPRIKAYLRTLVATEYKRLGWNDIEGESSSDRKLRATIIGMGAYADDPTIIKEALRRFEAYRKDPKDIPAELRSIIFAVAIKERATGAFELLLDVHDHTANTSLRADAMGGLTATYDTAEASKLLDRLTDARLVKPQDADYWLIYLIRNRHTRQVAWDWMVAHWPWVVETYGHDKSYDVLPQYSAGACNTPEWAERYRGFFEPKAKEVALKLSVTLGLQEIETRVAWLERDLPAIQKFFKQ